MFNQEFISVSCKNSLPPYPLPPTPYPFRRLLRRLQKTMQNFFLFRFIQFSLIVYLLIHFFIDWLIDFFIFLFFILVFINHQTQTEILLKNVRKITLESCLKLTYNPHMHSDHKRENHLVLSPLSWCTTCGGLGLSLCEQQVPLAPLHPLAEI